MSIKEANNIKTENIDTQNKTVEQLIDMHLDGVDKLTLIRIISRSANVQVRIEKKELAYINSREAIYNRIDHHGEQIPYIFSQIKEKRVKKVIDYLKSKEINFRTDTEINHITPFSCVRYDDYNIYVDSPKLDSELRHYIIKADPICRYCMKNPSSSVDHVWPRALGGCAHPHNLVGACTSCNFTKSNLFVKEFTKKTGHILHIPPRWTKE